METTNHDNVNVKVNSRITIYGNVVFVGSISIVSAGFVFLAIFMLTHWAAAIVLSAVLVYGLVTSFFLVIVGAVAAIWIKFVIHPTIDARERNATIRGQEMKNRVVWAQPNAVVVESTPGVLQTIPLFPQQMIEAPKQEPWSDKATVLELFNEQGNSLRDIAARTGVSYYQVQKWTSEEKAKTVG